MILCVFYYNVLSCVAGVRTIADCTLQRSVCNCNKDIIIIIIIIIIITCCTLFYQVVIVNHSGSRLDCEYGSRGRDQQQSLVKPLSLCLVDESHFLVVDYCQHRIHLLTTGLQFVRQLLAHHDPSDPITAYPRHVCIEGGKLFVGTESGTIAIYRVQRVEEQQDKSLPSSPSSVSDSFVVVTDEAANNA